MNEFPGRAEGGRGPRDPDLDALLRQDDVRAVVVVRVIVLLPVGRVLHEARRGGGRGGGGVLNRSEGEALVGWHSVDLKALPREGVVQDLEADGLRPSDFDRPKVEEWDILRGEEAKDLVPGLARDDRVVERGDSVLVARDGGRVFRHLVPWVRDLARILALVARIDDVDDDDGLLRTPSRFRRDSDPVLCGGVDDVLLVVALIEDVDEPLSLDSLPVRANHRGNPLPWPVARSERR